MRTFRWLTALAAAFASPAIAQDRGMSGVEGITMSNRDSNDIDKAISSVKEQQAGSPADPRPGEESLAYRENLRIRRQQAEQYAAAARNGAALPPDAAGTLRHELAADIEQWRGEFGVGRSEWRAMRDRWLDRRDSLTAAQWAQRRVDWWAARDAWVASHQP